MAYKSTKGFERYIKAYLDRYAERDESFAEKYIGNDTKSIESCCDYIASEVKKMGVTGLEDAEVYGLAIHYYDEENIAFEKTNYEVVCNHPVELTEEEKAEAKAEALRQYQEAMYKEYVAKNSKKKENKKEESALQLSLF